MFDFDKILKKEKTAGYAPVEGNPYQSEPLPEKLQDCTVKIREICNNSSDIIIHNMVICGNPVAFVMCEGLFNVGDLTRLVITPLTQLKLKTGEPESLFQYVNHAMILAADQKIFYTMGELFRFIMSGFVVMLIEGKVCGIAMGLQGFQIRSISEPSTEINVRASQEGFVEALRVNMGMVRRRLKTPQLCMEMKTVGTNSNTDVCLVYRSDMVSPQLLQDIRYRLTQVKIDNVLESGYLQPFLENKPWSIFSDVGTTQRPDTLCAKVSEGRVALLVDGTPFALTIPQLFVENFQSFDDYTTAPFYATIIRWIKYIGFFISTLLPGMYVAIATFHPELFPSALLYNVAASEEGTPFPILFEALVIHLFYEIMREAGLRLPRAVGHAVSIIGALVIGDAAVTAGIIGSPMVMVVALTTISSFVIPSLYEAITFLRFTIIFAGGFFGLYGIAAVLAVVMINICAVNDYGIPISSPATPLSIYSLRDILFRTSWSNLSQRVLKVQDVPGSEIHQEEDGE